MKLSEMKMNIPENMVVLLTDADERTAKNGSKYCALSICDGETKASANMFSTEKSSIQKWIGGLVTVNMKAALYNGQVSYTVNYILPAPKDANLGDYVKKAPYDGEWMYNQILAMVPECDLKPIVAVLYEKNKDKLLYWAAASSVHHNIYGGLLFHTYRMMQSAVHCCDVYKILEPEILLPAVALHDIGKLKEMETSKLGEAEYTLEGNLSGHLLIGHDMVREAATNYPEIPGEKVRMLDHCILSHHGKMEYGAIRQPAIPEAMALYMIDNMDAKMYQYEENYSSLKPGETSEPIRFMDGIRIYKPDYSTVN